MHFRAAVLVVATACACNSSPPRAAGALTNMSELVDGSRAQTPDGTASVTLRGQPLKWLSSPYNAGQGLQDPARDGLVVQPAFADARPAAFVTTEIWDGYPRVWAQPLYVPVTGFDPVTGPVRLPDSLWIFATGPGSGFYSPYWQTYFVTVPAGYPADGLRSAEQVLSSGFPLTPGPLRYASIGPQQVEVARTEPGDPVHPFTQDVLQRRVPQQAWAEGGLVWAVDFGPDRFRINAANNVVQEVALFRFAVVGPDGQPQAIDVPPLVGTGPLGTPRAADAPNGFPRFGAFRHEYDAVITAAAGGFTPGVFVSASRPELRQHMIAQLGAAMVPVPSLAAELLAEREQYTLRVALDGSCFTQTDFPNSCIWFDTQQSIEANLPSTAFIDLKRFSSGALVFFDGVAP